MIIEWISVKDKLPEIDYDPYYGNDYSKECIVFNGSIVIKQTAIYSYRNQGWCLSNLSEGYEPSDYYDYGLENITHWMPLPDAPEAIREYEAVQG